MKSFFPVKNGSLYFQNPICLVKGLSVRDYKCLDKSQNANRVAVPLMAMFYDPLPVFFDLMNSEIDGHVIVH